MAMQIQRQSVPNPDYLHFNIRVEISKSQIQSFYRPLRPTSDAYLIEVGEKGAELVKRVMAISGVTEIFIKPYELDVLKAPLFKWEEIAPHVEKAIKVIFGGEREDVKYLSLAEIPLAVILAEPWKRLGWLIRKAWYRIPNLAQ